MDTQRDSTATCHNDECENEAEYRLLNKRLTDVYLCHLHGRIKLPQENNNSIPEILLIDLETGETVESRKELVAHRGNKE